MDNFKIIIKEYFTQILIGIGNTLLLALVGTVVGFFLALIFANLRILKIEKRDQLIVKILKKIGSTFSKIYVTVFRGTPMIVQAVIFYYSFHQFGLIWTPMQAGLFTVSLNTTAYLTEVIRGAIQSLDKGQMEAARSLGLSKTKAMIYIIIPQAVKNSMAPIGNEFIINIKDTAVLSIIQVFDLFSVMKSAAGTYYLYVESMLIAAAIYLILTLSTSMLLRYLEQKIGVPSKPLPSSN
ncbi:MAG: amino acid ABC transporter permease [Acholeplasmataceae bacterium]|nr:amino acid ABC transporter permease [Acholeplasmataceae bacterium]HPT89252.1 amino acid ABC transporter permease [Bacilli bacterium]HQA19337.1 amino acid ABC transporter permease [Bacilli bacterium]HQD92011.1 amino acid ABC transporter permease [Bacilli bacterium]